MDQFEKKLKDFYEEKRKLDEISIPAFSKFLNKPEMITPVSRFGLLYKRVATFAAIAIPAAVILYYFNNSKKLGQDVQEISTLKIDKPLPSQSLLNSSNSAPYIWKWRAPTDKFLQEAYKSINNRY